MTNAPDLRPRSPSELVDAGFRLLRRHYGAFILLGTLAAVPSILVNVAQLAAATGSVLLAGSGMIGFVVLALPFYAVSQGALTAMTAEAYQTGEARPGPALGRAFRRVLPAIGTAVLFSVAFMVGFLLLVVPGVYVLGRLASAFPAVILEDLGPIEALQRAWARATDRVGHSLGALALTFLLYVVIMMGGMILAGLLGAALGGPFAVLAVSTVITVLVSPMIPIVTTLLYYDLRIRSEGYDLEVLSGQLDGAAFGGAGAAGA